MPQMINLKEFRSAPPISLREPIRFTPESWKEDGELKEGAPVFLIKVPSIREKIALDTSISLEGVRFPSNQEMAQTLRAGVIEFVADEDQPNLLQILDEFEAAADEGIPATADLSEQIDQIIKALRPVHRPLSRLESERTRFLSTAMLIRAEMFLVGIEGVEAPILERKNGHLTDECLDRVEQKYGTGTLFSIGIRSMDLTTPTEDEKKVSESLEPSPLDPMTLMEDPLPPISRRGKSSGNGMRPTPA